MAVEKKVPLRKCVGCGERRSKKELIRVVKENETVFSIDKTGKKNGRGAYICNSLQCLRDAHKKHALERSFSCQIPDTIYQKLEEELVQGEDE
jgi:predicted RNA-binding protein YlxR (DUF448 family)